MKRVLRDMSTAESRSFWESAERAAPEVEQWPDWKRAGINVTQMLEKPREFPNVPRPTARQSPRKK